jgi:hypothetical protein
MRLLKESLLHFVVLGGLMFAAHAALGGPLGPKTSRSPSSA